MSGIFLSYRRADSTGWAGRLHDSLQRRLPGVKIFMDMEEIPPGVKFADYIRDAVGCCDALIALIGPGWLMAADREGRHRLEDPADFTRLEIVSALERDVRVIPTLVGGARMPEAKDLPDALRGLCDRQNYELSDRAWEDSCNRLANALKLVDTTLRPTTSTPADQAVATARRMPWMAGASVLALSTIGLTVWAPWKTPTKPLASAASMPAPSPDRLAQNGAPAPPVAPPPAAPAPAPSSPLPVSPAPPPAPAARPPESPVQPTAPEPAAAPAPARLPAPAPARVRAAPAPAPAPALAPAPTPAPLPPTLPAPAPDRPGPDRAAVSPERGFVSPDAGGPWVTDTRGCRIEDSSPKPGERFTWSGACVDGKAEGPGRLAIQLNGSPGGSVEGTMQRGRPVGVVRVVSFDGVRYEGPLVNGKPQGRGQITLANGSRLSGSFQAGKLQGQGVATRPDGWRYEGEFRNSVITGRGVQTDSGGRYVGDFVNGRMDGRGLLMASNGIRFEGGFKANKPNGTGVLTLANGTRIAGSFVNGEPDGRLVIVSANGQRQEKTFVNGKEIASR